MVPICTMGESTEMKGWDMVLVDRTLGSGPTADRRATARKAENGAGPPGPWEASVCEGGSRRPRKVISKQLPPLDQRCTEGGRRFVPRPGGAASIDRPD